jgi:hypothetical protein
VPLTTDGSVVAVFVLIVTGAFAVEAPSVMAPFDVSGVVKPLVKVCASDQVLAVESIGTVVPLVPVLAWQAVPLLLRSPQAGCVWLGTPRVEIALIHSWEVAAMLSMPPRVVALGASRLIVPVPVNGLGLTPMPALPAVMLTGLPVALIVQMPAEHGLLGLIVTLVPAAMVLMPPPPGGT